MVTQFFDISEWPQGLAPADRYHASITRKGPPILLDVTFISTPREVWSAPDEQTEHRLLGWNADVSVRDCAVAATLSNTQAAFETLKEEQPDEEIDANEVAAAYERAMPPPVPPPPAPVKYSKLKIYAAMTSLGKDAVLEEYMKSATLPNGMNMYKAWLNAQEISNTYPGFYEILPTVATVVGMSVERIEEVLEGCILDENAEA